MNSLFQSGALPTLDPFQPPPAGFRDTSVQAASLIERRVAGIARTVLAYVSSCGTTGATDEQISQGTGIPENSARPRRLALVRAGFLRDSGQRRLTKGGNPAIVWVATGV
jgi:hypothetical protein